MITLNGRDIPESALTMRFVRAGGPGGQHVNKVATAVELRLNLNRVGMREEDRKRLEAIAGTRLTAGGEIVIFAERHRSQARNRKDALARLNDMLCRAAKVPKKRVPTKPSRAMKAQRLDEKKHRGAVKRLRKPPTKVEQGE